MSIELAKALVAAQGIAKAVEKDSKNAHHNYKYASAESIIEESREALTQAGLSLVTLGWRPLDCPGRAPRVEVTYLLLHTSGESREFVSSSPVIPGQGRPEDKAEFGAITENLGYFLRGLLLLPRVDEDVSVSGRNDTKYTPVPPPPRQPAAIVKPPTTPPKPAPTGEVPLHTEAKKVIEMADSITTPEQAVHVAKLFAAVAEDMPVDDAVAAFSAISVRCETEAVLLDVCKEIPAMSSKSKSDKRGPLQSAWGVRVKALKAGVGVGK